MNIKKIITIARASDTLRFCPSVSLKTSLELSKIKKSFEKAVDEYQEATLLIEQKHEDRALRANDYIEINKREYDIEFTKLKSSDFPNTKEDFGVKKINDQEIHFVDSFIELYELGIIED